MWEEAEYNKHKAQVYKEDILNLIALQIFRRSKRLMQYSNGTNKQSFVTVNKFHISRVFRIEDFSVSIFKLKVWMQYYQISL